MRRLPNAALLAIAVLLIAVYAVVPFEGAARAEGEPPAAGPPPTDRAQNRAPRFQVTGVDGEVHRLEDYRGRWVVLEWTSYACPFVRKHYHPSRMHMQTLQRTYTGKGVAWLTVCSSAEGKPGHMTADEWKRALEANKSAPTEVLLDASGVMGRAYGARTTPEIRVIDPEGRIRYRGAVDDRPSTRPEDIDEARCYVSLVLDAALAGEEIPIASTRSYGCSIKYAN